MSETFTNTNPGVAANALPEEKIEPLITAPVFGGEPPAAIVGTATTGPAFVPFDLGSNSDFETIFGDARSSVENKHFGALGANSYFDAGGSSIIYVRPLGAGDCKQRVEGDNAGRVNNAGFVVGSEIVNTGTNLVGLNTYAGSQSGPAGALGRAYFLTAFMSQSNDSTIFSDSGLQTLGDSKVAHIIRGMLFAPSGVVLSLSSNLEPNNTPVSNTVAHSSFGAALNAGCNIGTLNTTNGGQTFVLLMNGHKSTTAYPNMITASLNPLATHQDVIDSLLGDDENLPGDVSTSDSLYFADVFNTDPTKIQEAGHYLYAHYDIFPLEATPSIAGLYGGASFGVREPSVLLLTSSLQRNTGSVTSKLQNTIGVPNFENFEDRFTSAYSPFVTSQKIGSKRYNLFRFYSITDGDLGQSNLRIVIGNIRPGENPRGYAKFDIELFAENAPETAAAVFSFDECDLDPRSKRFISKVVGDRHRFFDFDETDLHQKVVINGSEPITNRFVRVEVSNDVSNGVIPKNTLPVGFRGIYHLVTSGTTEVDTTSAILTGSFSSDHTYADSSGLPLKTIDIAAAVQPPLPMRERLSLGIPGQEAMTLQSVTWGVQYSRKDTPNNPNAKVDAMTSFVHNLTKFMPSFHTTLQNPWVGDNEGAQNIGGCILDADKFNRNFFTLENVAVITGTVDGEQGADLPPHPSEWPAAIYIRDGKLPALLNKTINPSTTDKVRFVNPEKDLLDDISRSFLRFTVPMHSGFDGLNIFDEEAVKMSDTRVYRERLDPKLAGKRASTTAAYTKCIEILAEKTNADMMLLATPGIKHRAVTDKPTLLAEDKFNFLYISDVEPFDASGSYVTSSLQPPGIKQVSTNFANRALDSSFGAFYYPDLTIDYGVDVPIEDPPISPIQVPATVGVLSAIANNDANFSVGSAPMGIKRGVINRALSTAQGFTNKEKSRMLNNSINVIDSDNTAGAIFSLGQMTSLGLDSSLSRINVRRLVIDIRRRSRDIARLFLLQPNTTKIRNELRSMLNTMLSDFVADGSISSFDVTIFDPNRVLNPVSTPDSLNELKLNLEKFKAFGNLLNRQNNTIQELQTIRGTIFIKPVQSDEMIKLDIDETTEE